MSDYFVMHQDYGQEADKMVFAIISATSILHAAQKVTSEEIIWQKLEQTEHLQMLSDSEIEFEVYEIVETAP